MTRSSKTERTFQAESAEHGTAGNVLGMVSVTRVGKGLAGESATQGQSTKITQ